jgi:hypothetical protein
MRQCKSYERFRARSREAVQYEIDANAAKFKLYEPQKALAAKLASGM